MQLVKYRLNVYERIKSCFNLKSRIKVFKRTH